MMLQYAFMMFFSCITLCNYALSDQLHHNTMEIVLMPVGGDLWQIQAIQGLSLKGGVPYIFILKPQFSSCPSADSL